MVSDNWLSFPVVVVSIKLFKLAYLLVLHRIWSWTIGTVTYLCYTWRTTAGPCNETGFSSNANPVGLPLASVIQWFPRRFSHDATPSCVMSSLGLGQHKSWRSEPQHLFAAELSTAGLVAIVRQWIERCTGNVQSNKTFMEYLEDGTVLCELIQHLVPGMIRKVNKIRSPFAWRENISFFLSACSKLGLGPSQLFSPEDLISTTSSSISNIHHKTKSRNSPGTSQNIRQICVTVCYLALELASRPDYAGPSIQLEQQILPFLQTLPERKTSAPVASLPSPSSPELTSVTTTASSPSSSSCGSTLQSPSGYRTRRVESVTHLVTETSCTDIQSYAELVLYLNGSTKEYTTVAQPGAIRLTQSFNRPFGSKNSRVHRTLSDRTPFLAKLPYNLLQDSVSDNDIHSSALQQQFAGIFKEEVGWEKFEDFTEGSTATPSDTSTVICREVPSSRCSSSLQAAPEENHITSSAADRVSESAAIHSSACPDNSRDDNCTKLAQEVELLQQTASISPGKSLESELAQLLHSNLNESSLWEKPQPKSSSSSLVSATKIVPESGRLQERKKSDQFIPAPKSDLYIATSRDSAATAAANSHPSISLTQQTSQQVTDIHSGDGLSSDRKLALWESIGRLDKTSGKRAMDSCVCENGHASSNSEHPVSLNGMKTRGYPSNCQVRDLTSGVPHHSLSLATSDPDSPSSSQVNHFNSEGVQPLKFGLAPLGTHRLQNISGLDISRVQSDALPQSSLPSMVICGSMAGGSPCPGGETSTHAEGFSRGAVGGATAIQPRFLSDARSIDTNSMEDMEDGYAVTDDGQKSLTPMPSESPARVSLLDKSADPHNWNGPMALEESQRRRPGSGPPHRASGGLVLVSPSHSVGRGETRACGNIEDKRKSVDSGQKRMTNIQKSSRTAVAYSPHFKTDSKSNSLPRDSRGGSVTGSIGSMTSEDREEVLATPPASWTTTPSGAATSVSGVTSPQGSVSGNPEGIPSGTTPFNLHALSMDQTREVGMNQMFEIWKEVEESEGADKRQNFFLSHSPIPSSSLQATSSLDQVDADAKVAGARNPQPPSQPSSSLLERQRSDVLQVTDISISVGHSTPYQIPQAVPPARSLLVTPRGKPVPGATSPSTSLRSSSGGPDAARKLKNRPTSFSNKHIDCLLDTLKSLSCQEEDEEDLKMLEDMLKSDSFQEAKHVHDDVVNLLSGTLQPAMKRIVPNTQMMREHLHHHTQPSPEVNELRELLRTPHFQALLFCHDKVSTSDLYVPDALFHRSAHDPVDIILSPSVDNFHTLSTPQRHAVSSRDVPSNRKEGATIVCLERTNRPLGCTIYKQGEAVFIGRLLKGCDAEASDKLREGDELLEVNGVPVAGKRTEDIIHLMSGDVASGSILSFTIIPIHDDSYDETYEPKYVRAHFSYDGAHDDEVPCKALALVLHKEDILELVQEDDPNWWQACKVFEDGGVSLPGLVPSMHLQQQREAMIRSYPYSTSDPPKKGLRGLFSKKKKKKIFYQNTPPSNILGVGDEIPTYEEVIHLDPDPSLCRPIVLVGAPGVGRKALIRKLVNSDPSVYQPVIRCATHGLRPGDVNCREFMFMTREEFERDIDQDRFLEYGEVKGHFYGTAFSTIKQLMESGHVPVLDAHPQALKKLRHSGLKPYVIFVASPRLERLQATRKVGPEKTKRRSSVSQHVDTDNGQVYTEAELQQIVRESCLIETQYGHYFDWIIVNDDFQVATDMLKEVTRRLEYEPQWVPASWKNY